MAFEENNNRRKNESINQSSFIGIALRNRTVLYWHPLGPAPFFQAVAENPSLIG